MLSGGLITDFIRMLKISFNNASKRRAEVVTTSFLDEAFMDLVNEYDHVIDRLITGYEYEYYQILKEINNTKNVDVKNEYFRNLLFYLFILEYKECGLSWYNIHPLLKKC